MSSPIWTRRWVAFATSGAVLFGLSYACIEQVLRTTSIVTVMLVLVASQLVVALACGVRPRLRGDLAVLLGSRRAVGLLVASVVAIAAGQLCLLRAMQASNATASAVIEVSYPIFTALAGYLLFGRARISRRVLLGGGLIFAGIVVLAAGGG